MKYTTMPWLMTGREFGGPLSPRDPWARTCKGLQNQHEMVVVASCFNALLVQTLGRHAHHNEEDHDARTDGERGVCGRRERAHRQPQGRGRERL